MLHIGENPSLSGESLANIFFSLRLQGKGTDIDISIINGQNVTVYSAHKIILAADSDYFDKLLYGSFNRSSTTQFRDIDPQAFDHILDLLYRQRLTILSFDFNMMSEIARQIDFIQPKFLKLRLMLTMLKDHDLIYNNSIADIYADEADFLLPSDKAGLYIILLFALTSPDLTVDDVSAIVMSLIESRSENRTPESGEQIVVSAIADIVNQSENIQWDHIPYFLIQRVLLIMNQDIQRVELAIQQNISPGQGSLRILAPGASYELAILAWIFARMSRIYPQLKMDGIISPEAFDTLGYNNFAYLYAGGSEDPRFEPLAANEEAEILNAKFRDVGPLEEPYLGRNVGFYRVAILPINGNNPKVPLYSFFNGEHIEYPIHDFSSLLKAGVVKYGTAVLLRSWPDSYEFVTSVPLSTQASAGDKWRAWR